MDPYKHLHMTLNSDGSITRNYPVPFTPPSGDNPLDSSTLALSKDIPLRLTHNTSIRIFIPNKKTPPPYTTTTTTTTTNAHKLPLILYFHAGGFVLCSPSISPVHTFTSRIASQLPAIVLSVDHRLAPEHRLPAAYNDALDALVWVRDQACLPAEMREPWLKQADFSRCFLMGSSSGGNIAYHLALQAIRVKLGPMKIAGVIMDQPFFGGEDRTESEVKMADDSIVPLAATDLMWEMALPIGANRDHEYSKPPKLVTNKSSSLKIGRCLVRGYLGDPLIDRMRIVAEMLEEEGVEVVAMLEEEGFHGVELYNPSKAQQMMVDLRSFVYYNDNDNNGNNNDFVVVSNAPKFYEQCGEQSIELETVQVV